MTLLKTGACFTAELQKNCAAINACVPEVATHATTLSICPVTGPTIAPVSEGHYYYTSVIGEKWIWVYGDPAPYPFAKYYGENKTATIPANTSLFTDTFIVPRDGTISISGTIYTDNNTQQQSDVFIYAGVPSENFVFIQRTLTDLNDQARNHGNSGTATNVVVAAGDTITYSMRNDTNSIAIYRINYQYQN